MPKNDDVKIATELYEKLPEHEKKLAAALINATAAQLLAISMAYGDKVKDKELTGARTSSGVCGLIRRKYATGTSCP